jgi:glycosyltransferase involved in cell wall biosynthesis
MKDTSKRKVLHLTTHLNIGGITSYLAIAGAALAQRGVQLSVLSSGGNAEALFREKDIPTHAFPIKTKSELNPKLLFCLPRIIRLVKEEKFVLLHAHTRVTQVLAAWVSRFTGVPVITTAHGYYKPRLGRRLFGCWGKMVIAISPLVAEELEKSHKIKKSKIRVIYNAVDIKEYRKKILEKNPEAVRAEHGIPQGAFLIGSISRLVKDKGHEYLLRAAAKLKKKNPHIFVLIVGDGREKKPLEKLIHKLGLEKNAKLLSSQPDISGILSALDVFAHPATFREGFGLSMLEAMVAKIPVVTTDIWAINSIIRDRVNGYLVAPKNADALAEALKFVLENPDVAGSVAHNAFQMASQAYSSDRLAAELDTVYDEVLAAHA